MLTVGAFWSDGACPLGAASSCWLGGGLCAWSVLVLFGSELLWSMLSCAEAMAANTSTTMAESAAMYTDLFKKTPSLLFRLLHILTRSAKLIGFLNNSLR